MIIIRSEDFRISKLLNFSILKMILSIFVLIMLVISCKVRKVEQPITKHQVEQDILQNEGLELVLQEIDGDIMEFDVSFDSNLLAYSTNAYKNTFQILLMDFKENKKQYIMPENTEQRSPILGKNSLFFVKIDKGTSYITEYNLIENTAKTLFKINGLVLKLTAYKNSKNNPSVQLSFTLYSKGSWKIWLLKNGKFIFVDEGFAPYIAGNYVYFQKPNIKGSNFYSIYASNLSNGTKYSIISNSNKSYINPAVNKYNNIMAFVEFYENTYYLKLMDLKKMNSYTLIKSLTSILSPNLNVDGYVYFIWKNNNKFAIYRKKI